MKAAPLLIAWHNDAAAIYSAHFDPHEKGRLATAGGDNNVRLWQVDHTTEDPKVTYLSTLIKHTQAVNVVRWSPKPDLLASAGDDGNVILWAPSDKPAHKAFGDDDTLEDKETWHAKKMIRSQTAAEIYDLAWSPDASYFITGSMDNVARIFDAQSGNVVRQIAEHNHYVQGVAWDPLNEYLATQSSDRSVHVYALKTTDGQFSLSQYGRMTKMEMPPRRRTSNSPAPPDFTSRGRMLSDAASHTTAASPAPSAPSAPGTPAMLALPMNPPPPASSHSRRSSFGGNSSPAPSYRRSASPAPSMPLPAVMASASPRPQMAFTAKSANIYANETLTSFFRRLTFAPDGSLLFTPAGQYRTSHASLQGAKAADEVSNTVYIYSRGGLNKPPIAHLPGHKKPSIVVKCSPIFYNHRLPVPTKQITVDTSSNSTEEIASLPEPAMPSKIPTSMDPPPIATSQSPSHAPSPRPSDTDSSTHPIGPQPAFSMPYRIVYAVATQDSVLVYDTQQQSPLCVVSNLHYATFTDLTWSSDGLLLLITSSDGFCSALTFAPNELGIPYTHSLHSRPHHPVAINTASAPILVPPKTSPAFIPSLSPLSARPPTPTRSNSASSMTSSFSTAPTANNPTPSFSSLPSVAAAHGGVPSPTPPMTPSELSQTQQIHAKRESEGDKGPEAKRRRIAPTLVEDGNTRS